jgi:hypothetical protein
VDCDPPNSKWPCRRWKTAGLRLSCRTHRCSNHYNYAREARGSSLLTSAGHRPNANQYALSRHVYNYGFLQSAVHGFVLTRRRNENHPERQSRHDLVPRHQDLIQERRRAPRADRMAPHPGLGQPRRIRSIVPEKAPSSASRASCAPASTPFGTETACDHWPPGCFKSGFVYDQWLWTIFHFPCRRAYTAVEFHRTMAESPLR